MAEKPVNLPTAIYLGVFSRAEQRVLTETVAPFERCNMRPPEPAWSNEQNIWREVTWNGSSD